MPERVNPYGRKRVNFYETGGMVKHIGRLDKKLRERPLPIELDPDPEDLAPFDTGPIKPHTPSSLLEAEYMGTSYNPRRPRN